MRGRSLVRAAAACGLVVALFTSAGCAAFGAPSTGPAAQQAPAERPPDVDPPSPAEALLDRAGQTRAAAAAPAKAQPGEPPATPAPAADSLAVTFEAGTSSAEAEATVDDAGAVVVEEVAGTEVVEVDTSGTDPAQVTAELEADPAVEAVEPNLERRASRTPNDPELAAQEPALSTVGLPAAWDVSVVAARATVAVLDTGVDTDHPELVGALVPGFDAVNEDSQPEDDNGHGTAVAGIIGAATGNGAGIAGVAWNARIMPVKVLDAAGLGTDVDIAQGIVWAADHGADVINLSLGGPGASTALDQAVTYAQSRDVVVVAATGNDASPALHYPAGAPGVLGVTATDAEGRFAWFSNHGPWVSIAAPGIDIRTTASAPGATPALANETGTSFASPIVAGIAALLRERHPAWGWDSVAWELLRTARDAGPAGIDNSYGYGVVNAAAALGVAPLSPHAQPNLAGDAGNFPASARPIAVGSPAQEALGYESDEDWFTFTPNPAGADVTVTVTPPPALAEGYRAHEIDPMVELYNAQGLVSSVDAAFEGEPETVTVGVAGGQHWVRVRNYAGAAGPAPYAVSVSEAPLAGGTTPGSGQPWFRSATPSPHSTGPVSALRIGLGRTPRAGTVTADTVLLVDGRTGTIVPSTIGWATPNITITPQVALRPGTAYLMVVAGVRDNATGQVAPFATFPFVTAGGAAPSYAVNGTYSPFSLDIDGNRYSDAFWYAPGTAADSLWLFDALGRVGLPTDVRGTYTPRPGDFDGNGYDDIFWYAAGAAADSIWFSGPNGITPQPTPVQGTYRPVVGDFDRNGYDDIFWYGRGAAADSLWRHGPQGVTRVTRSVGGDFRPLGGDFNRDGYDDIFWYAPGTAADALWLGGSAPFTPAAAPNVTGTWSTRVLDTNGDGFDDILWYSSSGRVLWRGGPTGFRSAPVAAMASTVRPVAGDLTGDLRDDVLAYVPGTARDPVLLGRDTGLG